MLKAVKVRLYPNKEQKQIISSQKENRQSQAKFVCISCGHTANADINASKNILARGIHDNNASLKIAV